MSWARCRRFTFYRLGGYAPCRPILRSPSSFHTLPPPVPQPHTYPSPPAPTDKFAPTHPTAARHPERQGSREIVFRHRNVWLFRSEKKTPVPSLLFAAFTPIIRIHGRNDHTTYYYIPYYNIGIYGIIVYNITTVTTVPDRIIVRAVVISTKTVARLELISVGGFFSSPIVLSPRPTTCFSSRRIYRVYTGQQQQQCLILHPSSRQRDLLLLLCFVK